MVHKLSRGDDVVHRKPWSGKAASAEEVSLADESNVENALVVSGPERKHHKARTYLHN
jgi:hypothetical protein